VVGDDPQHLALRHLTAHPQAPAPPNDKLSRRAG